MVSSSTMCFRGLVLFLWVLFVPSALADFNCAPLITGNYAVIVYPISEGGRDLAHYLQVYAPRLVPVFLITSSQIENDLAGHFEERSFASGFMVDGTHADAVEKLSALPGRPKVILAGDESAVGLVDDLREFYGSPYANEHRFSRTRFHKGLLGDFLQTIPGMPHINQAYSHSELSLVEWQKTKYGRYPVVLKPTESVGTDGVTLCHSEQELRYHFNRLIDKPNRCGRINKELLVQEVLDVKENEVVIDIVASEGDYKVFVMGRYLRAPIEGGAFIVTGGEVLNAKLPENQRLIEIAFSILKNIGWKNGPVHLEMERTTGKLIDFNGRVGGTWPSMGRASSGQIIYDWIVKSILRPSEFHKLPTYPAFQRHAVFYTVRSLDNRARFRNQSAVAVRNDLSRKFLSLHRYSPRRQPNDPFPVTRDVGGLGAIIELSSANLELLRTDLENLKKLDESGYFVEP